jgi:hypothetical protein
MNSYKLLLSMVNFRVKRHLDIGTCTKDNWASVIPSETRLSCEAAPKFIANCPTPCFYGEALQLNDFLSSKSFDLITALDFIEHNLKENGYKIITMLENLCRGRLIFFTPLGDWCVYSTDDKYQCHLSGWHPSEFISLGYSCWVFPNFHKESVGLESAFFAIKDFDSQIPSVVDSIFTSDDSMFKENHWEK